jgi:translation initiation factor 1A
MPLFCHMSYQSIKHMRVVKENKAEPTNNVCIVIMDDLFIRGGHIYIKGVNVLANQNRKKSGQVEEPAIVRVKLPSKRNREIFAEADLMLGANHIRVRCFDGITRTGRIKGKIKKRVWIREGDVLIVVPWSFQDEKCDIIYRYTRPQREWLQRNKYL